MKPNSAEKSEFFLLFDEHWEAGTGRPSLRKVKYDYWLPGEFLNQLENCGCKVSEDTLANWRNGKAVPREPAFKAILSVFFPTGPSQSQPQPEVNTDREKMRRAYEKAKAERQRQPKLPEPAPASKAKAGPAAADFAGPAAEPATVGSQPTAAIRAQEATSSAETAVLESDQEKLARLKATVANILSKSPAAMEALAELLWDPPITAEADSKLSAKVLIDHLMAADLKTSTRWLTAAHVRLKNTLNRDAVEKIEEVGQYVLPWILVLDPQFRGTNSVSLSTGAIIPIQVGARSLAVVVLAGIAACRVEFSKPSQTKDSVAYPVSPYTLPPVHVRTGPHNLIIQHLRNQLMEQLGMTTAYSGRSPEVIDEGIKDHLQTHAMYSNVHWHYILVLPDSPTEWPALRSVWAEVIRKYEYFSVIEVDPNLIGKHDRVWNSLRPVFGLLSG